MTHHAFGGRTIRVRCRWIFLALLLYFISYPARGQYTEGSGRDRFTIGLFYHDQWFLDVSYVYRTTMIGVGYLKTLKKKESWEMALTIDQVFGISSYLLNLQTESNASGYEYGICFGVRMDKMLTSKRMAAFLKGHIGPIYVSETPDRQKEGLLFSSGITAGVSIPVNGKFRMEVNTGIRHLSNAEVKKPNGGLNSLVIGVTLGTFL